MHLVLKRIESKNYRWLVLVFILLALAEYWLYIIKEDKIFSIIIPLLFFVLLFFMRNPKVILFEALHDYSATNKVSKVSLHYKINPIIFSEYYIKPEYTIYYFRSNKANTEYEIADADDETDNNNFLSKLVNDMKSQGSQSSEPQRTYTYNAAFTDVHTEIKIDGVSCNTVTALQSQYIPQDNPALLKNNIKPLNYSLFNNIPHEVLKEDNSFLDIISIDNSKTNNFDGFSINCKLEVKHKIFRFINVFTCQVTLRRYGDTMEFEPKIAYKKTE